ncbi:hypothetical protein [Demequina activiva]|uniref:Uncharacterized protein n=1 Tax=Demequina activiva TaxID=1582364 RepID=A0A919Q230_9MICO|nr:hypothetical protein [Demequina activiva]GIG54194.1 hypothetical protein Dac01nite_09460 [Demequina activiva]
MRLPSGDEGRFPVGALIAIALVGAAAYGAYWFLTDQGYLGTAAPTASPTAAVDAAGEQDSRPEWLQGTDHVLPAVVPHEDDRMPDSYVLQPWVWDLVDEDWELAVLRVGEGDQYTWFSDVQELYLISPTGEHFTVAEFDTTIDRDVVHWDPALTVAWIKRSDGSEWEQVIEFELLTQTNTYDFGDSAISTANRIEGGIANVDVVGAQPDGLELWVSYDANGAATGVFWRDGETWKPSLVQDEIRRMVVQGFSRDRGVDAWIDAEGGRAVFHGEYIDPDIGTVTDHQWVVHDLLVDSFEDDAVVATPAPGCSPLGGGHAGEFDGDRIVAVCDGTEWLLDPYELTEPEQR